MSVDGNGNIEGKAYLQLHYNNLKKASKRYEVGKIVSQDFIDDVSIK